MNFLQQRWVWGAMIIVAVTALFFIPTTYRRVISEGTDTYEAHRIFFGDRIIRKEIDIEPKTNGLGFILVNLKNNEVTPVEVKLISTHQDLLATAVIPVQYIQDDIFAWADLPKTLTASDNKVIIELKAPEAKNTNPLGIRFDLETQEPALSIARQVPLWQYLHLWSQDNKNIFEYTWNLITLTILITTVLVGLQHGVKSEKKRLIIGCTILILVAVGVRFPTLLEVKGVFGGDAFNYFLKSSAWIEGKDPFAADPRKGPLYTLLVLPGLLTPDPLLWGKLVTITAAAVTSVLATLVLTALSVPTIIALAGGLLLAVNRQLWWESVHSLANITFGALIIGSILVYVRGRPKKGEGYALGLLGALITLTRYEGILVPAILLPVFWIYERFNLKTLRQLLLPFVILLLIPFIVWPFTGELGVRTWSDIESDDGLFLAHSADDFQNNLKQYRLFIGRAWVLAAGVGPQTAALLVGGLTAVVLALIKTKNKNAFTTLQPLLGLILLGTIIALGIINTGDIAKQRSLIFTYTTGIGAGYLLIYKFKVALPLILIFISQSLLITWILPKDRYFIHLLPIMGITMMLGLFHLSGWHRELKKNVVIILLSACLVSAVYWNSKHDINGLIDKYNEKAEETTIILDVGRFLRPTNGKVAVAGDYLPLRVYLTDARLKRAANSNSEDMMLKWLENEAITYVVDFEFEPIFRSTVQAYPNRFETIQKMQANGYKGSIYKLKP